MRDQAGRFNDRFQEIAQAQGWRQPLLSTTALRMWEGFVSECEIGYGFDLSEYLNDLAIRDLLASALADAEMSGLTEYEWLVRETGRIDSRFRELLANGPVVWSRSPNWWSESLPGFGSEEFVSDVKERQRVVLRIKEE